MNQLLLKAMFYGSALLIGGTFGGLIAYNCFITPQQNQDLQVSVDEVQTEEPIEQISITVEESAETMENEQVEEPAQAQVKPSVSQNKVVQPISRAEPKEETWVYYMDEEDNLWLCPSQLSPEARNVSSARLNAIGIVNSGPNPTSQWLSLNSHIESWWDDYKRGLWSGKHMMSVLSQMLEFDSTWANSRIAFFIDFDGLFVTWDNSWENGKSISASDEQMRILDQMASDGTNYLRWLDSTYKARCPND